MASHIHGKEECAPRWAAPTYICLQKELLCPWSPASNPLLAPRGLTYALHLWECPLAQCAPHDLRSCLGFYLHQYW